MKSERVYNACLLSAITRKKLEKNTNLKYSVILSNSAKRGIIPQNVQFDKNIANEENIDRYYVVKVGDFIYNPRISTTAPCGPINQNDCCDGVVSPLYTVFSCKTECVYDKYLKFYFQTSLWHEYIRSVANTGARHDRMNVSDKDFFSMLIKLPPIAEQRKIAEILSAQDRIIELKTKLLEEKKRLKKYLCQLIMGGNKIKLARGYSVHLLSSITKKKLIKNKDLKYSVVLSNSAKYGIVPQNVQFDKNIANEENIDRYYVAEIGDFIYNPRISTSAPCGPINQNDCCDGVVSPLYTVFSCSAECVCDKYLKYYFQTSLWHEYIQSVANTGARYDRMNVSDKDFFSMAINLPPLNTQRQCVVLLDAFSNVIKLIEENLEQEKLKKKALMQQLLTGKVRVTV